MIQLKRPALNQNAANNLQQFQTAVNNQIDFPAKVAFAKDDFPKKKVVSNATFQHVKTKLIEMSSGAERCHYCEDSKADEVEHLFPKDVYPDRCYDWLNYYYSCGPCNVKKNNKFAVIDLNTQELIDITPPKKRKNGPPLPLPQPAPLGIPAFINLETENPLDFFMLDLQFGSFEFSEFPAPDTIEFKRAKFTLETLELTKKAFLRKAREYAYGDFKARLRAYIQDKENKVADNLLNQMIVEIKTHSHPTVWKEMIRQKDYIPALKSLFDKAPEAITW
jgi:hypothetical protein